MFGNFSLFKTPFPGLNSVPPSFVSFFYLLYFFLPPFKDLGCFSGCLISSADIQKLFCGIYSAFKCSFDEFVGEKVFSPSYSSAILGPPALYFLILFSFFLYSKYVLASFFLNLLSIFMIIILNYLSDNSYINILGSVSEDLFYFF